MKTLLKSQYLELKEKQQYELFFKNQTIQISDAEYENLTQYADGHDIIVVDDEQQQKTDMPKIFIVGGDYCIYITCNVSCNALVEMWDNKNNNVSGYPNMYNDVSIYYPYKRNEKQNITIYATAKENGKKISDIYEFNYVIPAWTLDEPLPGELIYDYTGCDFGIDEYGYNIISVENNTVSIKYCGDKEILTEAIIPETINYNGKTYRITSINKNALSECIKLKNIIIPNSVTSISTEAFAGCTNLTNINIPESVTTIDSAAFVDCENLTSITIPNSVTSIEELAFAKCKNLTSITIPESVTSIGNFAFSECYFTINDFINNSKLNAQENNYWGATIIDSNIDGLCIKNNSVVAYKNSNKFITIINIPNYVTSIGDSAFYKCTNLTAVIIPDSVTKIDNKAFAYCSNLRNITILKTTPPTLISGAFNSTNDCPIYVSAQSINAYKTANNWTYYENRIKIILI